LQERRHEVGERHVVRAHALDLVFEHPVRAGGVPDGLHALDDELLVGYAERGEVHHDTDNRIPLLDEYIICGLGELVGSGNAPDLDGLH